MAVRSVTFRVQAEGDMEARLTISDISKICCLPETTVTEWIRTGKLPCLIGSNGDLRVQLMDLVRLLQLLRIRIPEELCVEHPLKILIVDDEPSMRRLLRLNLIGQFPGVSIEESAEGFHAGWRAHDFVPDVMLLDIRMPGMDGFDVCRLLRAKEELKNTRIIVVSGLRDKEVQQKAMSLGANDFIAKPFDLKTLKEKILAQLPASKSSLYAA